MHCIANCRLLEPLNCPMITKTLKSHVGHGKLYIRPIQKNLSVISIPQDVNDATLKEKCKFCQKEFLLQDLRNHVNMCLPAIFDYCDYDSSTSSTDDLPEVQIGVGTGQTLLHNTPQRSPNTTSSGNDGNNDSEDVPLVDASYNNDDSNKDLVAPNSNTSTSGSAASANGHNGNAPQNMDIMNHSHDALVPTENQPETTSEALRVDSSLDDFHRKLDINKITDEMIHHCYVNNLVNPVEILRHMQKILV